MDLDERRLLLAEGTPCAAPYRTRLYDAFFAGAVSSDGDGHPAPLAERASGGDPDAVVELGLREHSGG
jgi:hypothetical protein